MNLSALWSLVSEQTRTYYAQKKDKVRAAIAQGGTHNLERITELQAEQKALEREKASLLGETPAEESQDDAAESSARDIGSHFERLQAAEAEAAAEIAQIEEESAEEMAEISSELAEAHSDLKSFVAEHGTSVRTNARAEHGASVRTNARAEHGYPCLS